MYNNNIKKLTYLDYSKWEAMQKSGVGIKKKPFHVKLLQFAL